MGCGDALRTNSKLKSSEYATPVLGLIFLRFADYRFSIAEKRVEKEFENSRRAPSKIDYQRQGVLYTPPTARYNYLLNLPKEEDIQLAIIQAMKDIEEENPHSRELKRNSYPKCTNDTLNSDCSVCARIDIFPSAKDQKGLQISSMQKRLGLQSFYNNRSTYPIY